LGDLTAFHAIPGKTYPYDAKTKIENEFIKILNILVFLFAKAFIFS